MFCSTPVTSWVRKQSQNDLPIPLTVIAGPKCWIGEMGVGPDNPIYVANKTIEQEQIDLSSLPVPTLELYYFSGYRYHTTASLAFI